MRIYGAQRIAAIELVEGAVKMGEAAFGTLSGPGFVDHFARATADDLSTNIWACVPSCGRAWPSRCPPMLFETALCWNILVPARVRAHLATREIDHDVLRALDVPHLEEPVRFNRELAGADPPRPAHMMGV